MTQEILHKWRAEVLLQKKALFSQQVVNKSSTVMDHSYKSGFKCSQLQEASVLFGVWIQTIFAASARWSFSCIWVAYFHLCLLLDLFFESCYFRKLFLINIILMQCLVISSFWTENLFHKQFPIEMFLLVLCTTWIFPQGWNVIFLFNSL